MIMIGVRGLEEQSDDQAVKIIFVIIIDMRGLEEQSNDQAVEIVFLIIIDIRGLEEQSDDQAVLCFRVPLAHRDRWVSRDPQDHL